MVNTILTDRQEAGQLLAWKLSPWANRSKTLILALPRGGVVVGSALAKILKLPLDIYLVRKLGAPQNPELAMGAIAAGQVTIINHDLIKSLKVSLSDFNAVLEKEQQELERRNRAYRGARPFPSLQGQTIILVDDGIATGSTILAALQGIQQQHPRSIIIASPVIPCSVYQQLSGLVERVFCLLKPDPLYSISIWYKNFDQVSDGEVCDLLQKAWQLPEPV